MPLTKALAWIGRASGAHRTGGTPLIQPYPGYATPDSLVARGRVLGRPVNHNKVLASFRTRKMAGVPVAGPTEDTLTDSEGYFTLSLPRPTQTGWIDVPVMAAGYETKLPVLVPRADAQFGIISDIDDTVMLTKAWSLPLNLWTTLRGRPHTRYVFPDAVELLDLLGQGGRNPVYYVSSGPWNLLPFLEEVFWLNNLPRGPMFLRDWGLRADQPLAVPAPLHKGQAIDTVLAANPALDFMLIGDTGQHDAAIYLDAARRHPGRIRSVVLRRAGRKLPEVEAAYAALGIPLHIVGAFSALPNRQEIALGI